MKVLRKLPPLHSTSQHVPLILEHSERGPRLISLEIFYHFACKRRDDQRVSVMTGDKIFFFSKSFQKHHLVLRSVVVFFCTSFRLVD